MGGGYSSFEFGHVAARGGAKVTIIPRPRDEEIDEVWIECVQRARTVTSEQFLELGVLPPRVLFATVHPARRHW